ncbi:MAG: hypothetical protein HYZ72_02455 [Deltaproteobacteria bacterium]|nr:hypothetical protein [Deltaproteobacteria bacterium]
MRRAAAKIERVALSIAGEAVQEIISDAAARGYLTRLRAIYERYETDLERGFSKHIIQRRAASAYQYPLYRRFQTLVSNEARLLNLNPSDHLLFIGSGPFPISAILFSQHANCTVLCFDKDESAVAAARSTLDRLSLSDRIVVARGRGEDTPVDRFSTAIVAVLARPKEQILASIFRAAPNCRVICRTTHGLRRILYEPVDDSILTAYSFRGAVVAQGDQTISSLLLTRS